MATPAPAPRKIIGLVVHGVGEQTVGSTLRSFMKEFFPLIRECIYGSCVRASDGTRRGPGIDVAPVDDATLQEVRIWFAEPGLDPPPERYKLVVREVHWAKAFAPPSLGGLLYGMVTLLKSWFEHVRGYEHSSFVNAVNGLPETGVVGFLRQALFLAWFVFQLLRRAVRNAVAVALMLLFSGPAFVLATVLLVGGWKGWVRYPHPFWRWLVAEYAKFQPSIVELAIILASPAVALLYIGLLVLESIGPISALLDKRVSEARAALAGVATSHLGDVWVYACQPWEASQIRTRFEERFKRLILEEGSDADAMFVLAHSLGGPVSYEGLSGERMKAFIRDHFRQPDDPEHVAKIGHLYYCTVGSALPTIMASIPCNEQERLYRDLPEAVHWEDFQSDYDPVQLKLITDYVVTPQYEADVVHPVNNQMDMFSEHTAYWNNAEQVVAPVLNLVTGGALRRRLTLNKPARVYRVSVLSSWKALAWLTAPALTALFLWQGFENPIASWLELGFLREEPWKGWFLRPVTWAAINTAFVVGIYSTFIKWMWDAWDHKVKYDQALPEAVAQE